MKKVQITEYMDDNDLPLVVPIATFSDYFQCSICMCNMTTATLTVCGHRYCDRCIREWVGRQHKCPCCNHQLTDLQLIKDHQFDSLISTIEAEKEKAESKYFDSLITAAANSENPERNMTPVELVLKKHLKQGLLEHERYFQTLKKSFQTKLATVEQTTERAIQELHTHGLSDEEVQLQTQDLTNTLERQKSDLHEELLKCASMVAEAYDKYLDKHVPNLDVLPVKVSICLPQKKIKIPDVTFQPMDTMKEVRETVEAAMIKKLNPVHLWEVEVRCFLFGPFAKCTECEMEKIIDDYDRNGVLIPDVQLLADGCSMGLQYGMKPGSILVVVGTIILESDLPKRCFIETFKPDDKSQRVDYFSCSDCAFKFKQWGEERKQNCTYSLVENRLTRFEVKKQDKNIMPFYENFERLKAVGNDFLKKKRRLETLKAFLQDVAWAKSLWICRSCMEVCHQGHQIAPYIMQHQPNWACCYCPKKKKCTIQPS